MIDRKFIYLFSVFLFLTIIKFINPLIIQKISFINYDFYQKVQKSFFKKQLISRLNNILKILADSLKKFSSPYLLNNPLEKVEENCKNYEKTLKLILKIEIKKKRQRH